MEKTANKTILSVRRRWLHVGILLLTLGMLSACEDAELETGVRLPRDFDGEFVTEEKIIGKWNLDMDGVNEINAGRVGLVLSRETKSYLTSDVIDINNDTLYSNRQPIDSWRIIYDYKGKADNFNGSVLEIVAGGQTQHWQVETAREDSIICTIWNDSLQTKTPMTMYREGSVYDNSPAIEMTQEEVVEFCTNLRRIADEMSQNEKEQYSNLSASKWMSGVADDVKLCNIAIPGTHDSGTYGIKYHAQFAAQTQRYNLKEQFDIGVRSFDLRVRNAGDEARIYHNFIPCELGFKEAIKDIFRKVAKSSECSFVFINTEGNDLGGAWGVVLRIIGGYLTFGGVIINHNALDEMATRVSIQQDLLDAEREVMKEYGMSDSEHIMALYRPDITMGESRGKVFIINRLPDKIYKEHYPFVGQGVVGGFSGHKDLITLKDKSERNGTAEDTIVCKNAMMINDLYTDAADISHSYFYEMKYTEWHNFFLEGNLQRVEGNGKDILYFNSASASIGDWVVGVAYTPIPDYPHVCENVYPKIIKDLKSDRTCGIIPMDYAGRSEYDRLHTNEVIACVGISIAFTYGKPILQQLSFLGLTALWEFFKPKFKVHGDELVNAILDQSRMPAKLESVKLNKDVSEIEKGERDTLRLKFYPADATDKDIESWSSSNPNVVALNDNVLLGVKQGNARVTVKLKNGMRASAYVVVGAKKMRAVSLGLSVDWADRNIGAAAPECDGYFYTWGDTDLRLRNYASSTYKYGAASDKYYRYSKNTPDETQLRDGDDPASQLGGGWRMPTLAEVQELMAKAEWKLDEKNGVRGYTVSHNGNSIFLPATGYFNGYDLVGLGENEGYFWTRDIYKSYVWQWDFANAIYIHHDPSLPFHGTSNMLRYQGLPIRPVKASQNNIGYRTKSRKQVKR